MGRGCGRRMRDGRHARIPCNRRSAAGAGATRFGGPAARQEIAQSHLRPKTLRLAGLRGPESGLPRWPASCRLEERRYNSTSLEDLSNMATRNTITVDGNEAAASVAHRVSEVIAIYPITPSSNMGEFGDEWSAHGQEEHLGQRPRRRRDAVRGRRRGRRPRRAPGRGADDDLHGVAGPAAHDPEHVQDRGRADAVRMHVAARTVATHALSIFGDHSDVMACRQTGFALLASGSVQEAHDFARDRPRGDARGAHSLPALLRRLPHLARGRARSRCSSDDDLRSMIDDELVAAHRQRALTPDQPVLRGTAQNPDVFFQAREACNRFYDGLPGDRREDDGPLRRASPAAPTSSSTTSATRRPSASS